MTEPLMKIEVNCTTGEEIVRPLTDEEIAQLELDRAASEQWETAKLAEQTRVNNLKESARAKLVTGESLTEEEAALIVL